MPTGPVKDAVDDVTSFLKSFGISLCAANAEVIFHPLMGYLELDGNVKFGHDSVASAKLGVKIEAQIYDQVKEASGVCRLLDNDQCKGQIGSARVQNSCSLCAGETRGTVFAELQGPIFFKKNIDIVKFGEDLLDCRSCTPIQSKLYTVDKGRNDFLLFDAPGYGRQQMRDQKSMTRKSFISFKTKKMVMRQRLTKTI